MAHKNKSNWSPLKSRKDSQRKNLKNKNTSLQSAGLKASKQGTHRKPVVIYDLEVANDRLEDLFRNHHFSNVLTHEQRLQLAQFYVLLMENQKKENFTRLLTLREIGIKHFIDSLIVPQLYPLQFPLLDLGTGPGFPGIPLKILFPDKKIILAEGVQKRVHFLKHVRTEMNLSELDILGKNIQSDFNYPVQAVITRALEEVHNTLTKVEQCLPQGGLVYFMKGPSVDPEIKLAREKGLGPFHLLKDIAYTLPHTPHQRRLLVYEKK